MADLCVAVVPKPEQEHEMGKLSSRSPVDSEHSPDKSDVALSNQAE